MSEPRKTRTLLFAISFPEVFDPEEVDPEMVADEMVEMINEERRRNGGFGGDVMVSGIPPCTWMTSRTITDLRAAVDRERRDASAMGGSTATTED